MTCVRHADEKFFPFKELRHFPTHIPEITEYTGTDNRAGILYRPLRIPVKPVYRYKRPALPTILAEKAPRDGGFTTLWGSRFQ